MLFRAGLKIYSRKLSFTLLAQLDPLRTSSDPLHNHHHHHNPQPTHTHTCTRYGQAKFNATAKDKAITRALLAALGGFEEFEAEAGEPSFTDTALVKARQKPEALTPNL